MFKVFPATIHDGRKIPLIKGWQEAATTDPEQIRLWTELFKERLKMWGVPTGPANGIFVLDIDIKGNGYETIKTLQLPPTMSQRTPSGGMHLIFKYPSDGKHYGNRVKFLPGLDTRGVGGWIAYYGADATPLADPPGWLLEQTIGTVAVVQGPSIRVDPSIAEGIILQSLNAIRDAPEGESNNVLNVESFKIGQLVASGSVSREYAHAALYRAAMERGKPAYESNATISSGLDGGSKKPLTSPFGDGAPTLSFPIPAPPIVARWTPPNFTRQDLMNTSNLKRPQLFEHWSTQDIHTTTADGGTGKSTLKLYEAICLALGDRFLGFNCLQPGKTLFITGEDSEKKLAAILGQMVRQMGLLENFPGFPEKVETILASVIVKKDADLCLIVKDRNNFIHPSTDAMRKLMEAVDDIKPKMIVFDPISSFWGSENALNDMNKAVTKFMSELAERSEACVEMINHMGKQSSANKDMSQFAGRGGSGLPSNARVNRVLRPILEEEFTELTGQTLLEKQSAMMCVVNKFTDGSPLYNKQFLILRDGYLFSRITLSESKQREAEKNLSDVEKIFSFIKDVRSRDKYPSPGVVTAHFAQCGDPISKERTKNALNLLQFQGHMGERLKLIENPDVTVKDRVYVICDMDDKEKH